MKKRKIMLGSAIMLAVLLVTGGTLAWFTASTEPVDNKFTAGTLEIKLVDNFEGAPNVNPGDCYDKEIYVENVGTKKAMVRIDAKAVFSDGLSTEILRYELGENWLYQDEYYYYTKVLETNERTTSLLKDNKICFDGPSMNNDYQGAELTITVEADAIQATNGAPGSEGWAFDPLAGQE